MWEYYGDPPLLNLTMGEERSVSERLVLHWNLHKQNLCSAIAYNFCYTELNIYEQAPAKGFHDVIISCDGDIRFYAHRLVLASISDYFMNLFQSNEDNVKLTCLILREHSYDDVKQLLEFIYKGLVTVTGANVESLLKLASLFKIKGLTDDLVPSTPPPVSVSDESAPILSSQTEQNGRSSPAGERRSSSVSSFINKNASESAHDLPLVSEGDRCTNVSTPKSANIATPAQRHSRVPYANFKNNFKEERTDSLEAAFSNRDDELSVLSNRFSVSPNKISSPVIESSLIPSSVLSPSIYPSDQWNNSSNSAPGLIPAMFRGNNLLSNLPQTFGLDLSTRRSRDGSPVPKRPKLPKHILPNRTPLIPQYSSLFPFGYTFPMLPPHVALDIFRPRCVDEHFSGLSNNSVFSDQSQEDDSKVSSSMNFSTASESDSSTTTDNTIVPSNTGDDARTTRSPAVGRSEENTSPLNLHLISLNTSQSSNSPHTQSTSDSTSQYPSAAFPGYIPNMGNVQSVPNMTNVPSMSNVSNLATVSSIPNVSNVPNVSNMASVPNMTNVPNMPSMGSMTAMPNMPSSGGRPEWKRYKQYSKADLQHAIDEVRNGGAALAASRRYKVPSRTLYDKIKKLGIPTSNARKPIGHRGRNRIAKPSSRKGSPQFSRNVTRENSPQHSTDSNDQPVYPINLQVPRSTPSDIPVRPIEYELLQRYYRLGTSPDFYNHFSEGHEHPSLAVHTNERLNGNPHTPLVNHEEIKSESDEADIIVDDRNDQPIEANPPEQCGSISLGVSKSSDSGNDSTNTSTASDTGRQHGSDSSIRSQPADGAFNSSPPRQRTTPQSMESPHAYESSVISGGSEVSPILNASQQNVESDSEMVSSEANNHAPYRIMSDILPLDQVRPLDLREPNVSTLPIPQHSM